jgi:Pyruvate/2-oxoglutarate dehydrogenase complex, dihydrolipoamide dehydrogenase (E3) component, and related enzymes
VADQVLLAFGRTPNTTSLGLDRAGVKTGADGAIIVDANSRTNIPNIYAVGDVSNQFKPNARRDSRGPRVRRHRVLAESLAGRLLQCADRRSSPAPRSAPLGLTELEARAQYLAVDVYKVRFRPLKAAVTGDCEASLLKVVVDCESDRILGIHIFAEEASEMIQVLAIASAAEPL